MRNRRAVSLVELLLAMSACTIVLTMSAGLIHRILHTQSKTRAFFDVERSSLRLANQFRRDVHDASAASAADSQPEGGVFLRLQLPDEQTVEYGYEQGTVVRISREQGQVQSREEFVFPPESNVAVRQESPRLVALSITFQPAEMPADNASPRSNAYAVPVSFQAEAALGRGTTAPVLAAAKREEAP